MRLRVIMHMAGSTPTHTPNAAPSQVSPGAEVTGDYPTLYTGPLHVWGRVPPLYSGSPEGAGRWAMHEWTSRDEAAQRARSRHVVCSLLVAHFSHHKYHRAPN